MKMSYVQLEPLHLYVHWPNDVLCFLFVVVLISTAKKHANSISRFAFVYVSFFIDDVPHLFFTISCFI